MNMNGRIYDPEIGRFLSADPFVQFPESTQGFNRYAYVGNNPLSYRDPSGYFNLKKELGRALINIAPLLNAIPVCVVWCAAVASAVGGYLLTGSGATALQMGAYAAAASALSYGINQAFGVSASNPASNLSAGKLAGYAVTNGVAHGALSKAGGGRFGDGFLGGFAGSYANAALGNIKGDSYKAISSRILVTAAIGGTVADIGGGKFANGARTAAYIAAISEMPSLYEKWVGYQLDMSPGGDVVQKEELTPPIAGANNVGVQGKDINDPCFSCENGPVSHALNEVPGINAVAGLHDKMQVSMGDGWTREVMNYPNMIPAAGFTYGAGVGQLIQSLSASQIIKVAYSRSLTVDEDARRSYLSTNWHGY